MEELPENKAKPNEDHYCKKCGHFIEYDKSRILLSSPPKYRGDCANCGDIVYIKCSKVD